MLRTFFIPLVVGFICFIIAAVAMNLILPHVNIDDAAKGLIKIVVWIAAFAGPAEYLRKKAKQKQAGV